MPAAHSSSFGLTIVRPPKETYILAAPRQQIKVWGSEGLQLGRVRHLVIEKQNGHITCALLSGQSFAPWQPLRPVPWSALSYDARLRAYQADVTQAVFRTAPPIRRRDHADLDLVTWRMRMFYGVAK